MRSWQWTHNHTSRSLLSCKSKFAITKRRGGGGGSGDGGGGGDGGGDGDGYDGGLGGTQNIMKNCTVLASRFMVYKWVTYQKE